MKRIDLRLEIRFCSLRISLRIVKPPHEVGGSSWLEVALDPIVDCGQSSELKQDLTVTCASDELLVP